MSRRLLAVTLTLLAAAVIAGLVLDRKSFTGNLLAEAVGVLISVWIAVALVERILNAERAKQWDRVREATYFSVATHIFGITYAFSEFLRDRGLEDLYKYTPVGADPAWANLPRSLAAVLRKSNEEPTSELYGAVDADLSAIRDVVIPRMVALEVEPTLVEGLIALVESGRWWREQASTAWRVDLAATTLEKAADVYAYLASRSTLWPSEWKPHAR